MDKCIKVELPTGHVLLCYCATVDGYLPIDDDYDDVIEDFTQTQNYKIQESNSYTDWLVFTYDGFDENGDIIDLEEHFKVIAQYGDEFPV